MYRDDKIVKSQRSIGEYRVYSEMGMFRVVHLPTNDTVLLTQQVSVEDLMRVVLSDVQDYVPIEGEHELKTSHKDAAWGLLTHPGPAENCPFCAE